MNPDPVRITTAHPHEMNKYDVLKMNGKLHYVVDVPDRHTIFFERLPWYGVAIHYTKYYWRKFTERLDSFVHRIKRIAQKAE